MLHRPRLRVGRGRAAAVVLLAMGLAGSAALLVRPAGPELVVESVVTGAGELATVRLDDGSVVRLAPSTRLSVGAPGAREVWLDGRAFLSVAHDEARPFRVRTPLGEALVLGTRFELEAREGVMQVAVVEGTVRIESTSGPVQVGANEVGRVIEGFEVEVAKVDDMFRRVAWVGDFFAFERTPLSRVAEEVSQRFGARVEVLDSALAERTVSGWYEGTSFGQTMEAVCLVVAAHCEIQDSVATVRP